MQDVRRPMDRLWDGLIALATTWLAIRVPLIWVIGISPSWTIRLPDAIASGLFSADFFVQWRRLGFSGRQLNRRQRAWLLLDLIAAFPAVWLTANPVLLALPLAKLPRMARLMRNWRKEAAQFGTQAKLILFVYWLALIAHWLSCGWAYLREPRPGHDTFTHYIYALYWCITTLATVGYGDLTPDTPGQMIYAMFVMIVGVGMFGYVIGNVAQWLANFDQAHTQYQSNLDRLATFMQYRRIPNELQRRIFDYYGYLWENRLVYDEFAVLAELPAPLQTEVSLILKREFIEKVPFLRGGSQQLIRDLSLELRPVIFMPGDFVFHAGEIARHMYFVSRGLVEVIANNGQTILNTLRDGDFFGEIALLFHQPRSASVRAVEYCNLYALDKATFERILSHHPEFANHIQLEAQRRREMTQVNAASDSKPT